MTTRNFTNTAQPKSLTAAIGSAAVVVPVASTAGYPTAPFTLAINRGQADEEVVLCTSIAADSFTVQRGYDGSLAVPHAVGAVVEPTVSAIDFREANAHSNDPAGADHTTLSAHAADPTGGSHTGLFRNSYYVASGDLMTATGSGALLRVPAGAEGRVLTMVAGLPTWSLLPAAPNPNNELAYLYSSAYDAGSFVGVFYNVLGLSVTFTVLANQPVLVEGVLSTMTFTSSGGLAYFAIMDGASNYQRVSVANGGASALVPMRVTERIAVAGTYTRKLMLQATGGGVSLNLNPANFAYGAYIRVTK